jgi:hypothetical protein
MSTPGPQAHSYGVMMYGSEAGYLNTRAQIWLIAANATVPFAFIRFCDPTMPFPPDKSENNIVYMHLPSSMFEPVLDLLRHEKVLTVYWPWGAGQAFLFTGNLSIGAGAILPAINPATPDPTIHPAAPRSGNG